MKATKIVLLVVWVLAGCSPESNQDKYNRLVEKELASGKKVDSIFFGIHLGMPQQRFFMHCWDMNKKGLFTNGTDHTGSMCVLYKLNEGLAHKASMNFYPEFSDSSIWKMHATFQYDGWAPWNKHLGADSLLLDVLALYKKWYPDGNSFIELDDSKKERKYIKVDGNRKIAVKKLDDVLVEVNYTDIPVEKQIKGKDEN